MQIFTALLGLAETGILESSDKLIDNIAFWLGSCLSACRLLAYSKHEHADTCIIHNIAFRSWVHAAQVSTISGSAEKYLCTFRNLDSGEVHILFTVLSCKYDIQKYKIDMCLEGGYSTASVTRHPT